jgi:aminoglycoside N3'-acetyltransferase
MQVFSSEHLADDLRKVGITPGDRLLVHSSLRAVGRVEDGAAGVLRALLDAVGPEGLLVAPTFTYDTPVFDPAVTVGRTGTIPEAVRTADGAVRSLHPFYSVAALGAGARDLCEGHELLAGTGIGTPLDTLAGTGGRVLLLGTAHTANTTVHVGEFHAGAGYLDIPFDPEWPTSAQIVGVRGGPLHVSYDRFAGCSRAFGAVERPLRERGAVRDGLVGNALVQLVSSRAIVEATVALLRADEAALLCTDARCFRCSRARARL